MKKFLLFPFLGLFACSLAGPSKPSPPTRLLTPLLLGAGEASRAMSCVTRDSKYVFHRAEIADAEGRTEALCSSFIKDEVLTIGSNGEITTDNVIPMGEVCTVGPAADINGCTVFIDLTCRNSIMTKNFRGWMTWEEDGSRGRGLSSMRVVDIAGVTCRSSYVVFATRI